MNIAQERTPFDGAPSPRPRPLPLLALGLGLALTGGCATGGPTGGATAGPAPLPPIPEVHGDLSLRVSYPGDSAFVGTRDRNFIFGSAGHGDARVWINGEEVRVEPNGGFLAFLPVPADSVYRLRATLGDQTATLDVPISLPPPPPAVRWAAQVGQTPAEPGAPGTPLGAGAAWIVPESVSPAGAWVARPGEPIPVSFTGTAGGQAWLELGDGSRVPLIEAPAAAGGATDFEISPGAQAEQTGEPPTDTAAAPVADYAGVFLARPLLSPYADTPWPVLVGPSGNDAPSRSAEPRTARVVLAVQGDTTTQPLDLNLVAMDADRSRVGVGWDPNPPDRNGDRHVIARPGPGAGPYHYVWRNGVEFELTGERNGALRVRLTEDLSAWTPAQQVQLRPSGTPPPRSRVSVVRLDPQPGWVDVHVNLDRPLPYAVQEGDRSVSLLVYGATSRASFLQHGRVDPYVQRAEWSQPSDDVFRLDVHLNGMPWGYEVVYGEGGDLILRLNRPPVLDAAAPLRGLTVVVDPGHGGTQPGAIGTTGLREADANLAIARALRDRLEAAGATVVMTRTTDTTVTLVERTELARERDADLLISVHNNAFPDGVNPWENNGTSVYYNHPRSAGLAWSVQRALLAELGLRDIGVGRADLHLPRFTWAPSILTETAFMMIPRQEAFLAGDQGPARIADAHVRGITAWLQSMAR